MRFTLSLVAIAGAVAAVSGSLVVRQTLPSCAVSCLTNADFGSCSHSDNSCLCHSQSFINSTTICITNACSGADLANAEAYSQAICRSVGVTLTATPSATSPAASGATSATASPASKATTGAAFSNNANALTGAAAVGFGILALVL